MSFCVLLSYASQVYCWYASPRFQGVEPSLVSSVRRTLLFFPPSICIGPLTWVALCRVKYCAIENYLVFSFYIAFYSIVFIPFCPESHPIVSLFSHLYSLFYPNQLMYSPIIYVKSYFVIVSLPRRSGSKGV